jgi:putative transposase
MSDYRFRKGLHLHIRGQGEYVIEGRLPNGELQIKDVATNEYKSLDKDKLVDSLFNGDLEILGDEQNSTLATRKAARYLVSDLSLLDDDIRERTKRRHTYVRTIQTRKLTKITKETLEPIIEKISKQVGDITPPSWLSLYRWYKQFQESGEDVRSLVPAYKKRGNRNRKFSGGDMEKSEIIINIIDKIIAERYLTRHRPTIESVCAAVYARIASENQFRAPNDQLALPNKTSIYDIINKLDSYEVTKARFGERIANYKFEASQQGPRPTRPLERVEIDHTKLDMLVVDSIRRMPIGRPWMTLAIDKFSRMIVGMYISFTPPSYLSVMQCLRHTIKPKTYVKDKYPSIKHNWDVYGIPELIVTDNGREFHSTHFEDACLQLGIVVQYAPPKRGQYKGTVERFFRTQNQKLLHGTPGTTFSNIIDKADYDPKKNAVISVEVLEELAHKFIVDIYHQDKHRTLNNTPAQVWKAAVTEYPVRLPPQSSDLDVLLGCIKLRSISNKGIELHSLIYNDERLARLRHTLKPGERVQVKYDPDDLSCIYVADIDNGEYIPVPAQDQAYSNNLTLWQHEVIKRYMQRVNKGNVNIVNLSLAKEEIQRIVEREWQTTKRTQSRQKMARFMNHGKQIRPETRMIGRDHKKALVADGIDNRNLELPHLSGEGGTFKEVINRPNSGQLIDGSNKFLPRYQEEPPVSIEKDFSRRQNISQEASFENKSFIDDSSPGIENEHEENDFDMTGWGADYDLPR